jgi:hypothetical protein
VNCAGKHAGSQLFGFSAVNDNDALTEQLHHFGWVNLFDLLLHVAQKFTT